jgi:hypothetical protein
VRFSTLHGVRLARTGSQDPLLHEFLALSSDGSALLIHLHDGAGGGMVHVRSPEQMR